VVSATTRRVVTVAALTYILTVIGLAGDLSLPVLNVLLVGAVVPLVWLIAVFCIWSAHQHAARYAQDVEKIHGVHRDAELLREAKDRLRATLLYRSGGAR
jgi:predicted ferric reductase